MKKGFTLIELLVVIAIIGILSAVVLGNLNGNRAKASDKAIMIDLGGVMTSAAGYYDTNKTYGTFALGDCSSGGASTANTVFSDSSITEAVNHAKSESSGAPSCGSSASAFALAVKLKTDATKWFCVDSTNRGTTTANASPISAAFACQ